MERKFDEILDRNERLLAVVSAEDTGDVVAEVTWQQTTKGTAERKVVICEVCVTTIENGIRTTICKQIKCPGGGTTPTNPPTTIRI
jgi:hypothetical protein